MSVTVLSYLVNMRQILLFVNDPRRSWKLIQFCNAMKKGGLYVLGHIIVTAEFQESFPEVRKQQTAWMKYIDFSRIKAFPQVAIAPTFEWGARNVVLSAGLGGMRPNIAVIVRSLPALLTLGIELTALRDFSTWMNIGMQSPLSTSTQHLKPRQAYEKR